MHTNNASILRFDLPSHSGCCSQAFHYFCKYKKPLYTTASRCC